LNPTSSISPISIRATGVSIAGACDRQQKIAGFDQEKFSRSHVLCIGAGGLISNIAPSLARKGLGALTILDHDEVEASNLNRQRFYARDIGLNKAIAMVRNLQGECTCGTALAGYAMSLETAIHQGIDLTCDVAICGVDNNSGRVATAQHFRPRSIPVIFSAVSADADHGYVLIQKPDGPCVGCLFPGMNEDKSFPCPGTPAIADVLQLMGALVTYAIDAVLTGRTCSWNYRAVHLSSGEWDTATLLTRKNDCAICGQKVKLSAILPAAQIQPRENTKSPGPLLSALKKLSLFTI
jgi:molybdopterin/thiamine biosynthesis adenylyltransferase